MMEKQALALVSYFPTVLAVKFKFQLNPYIGLKERKASLLSISNAWKHILVKGLEV